MFGFLFLLTAGLVLLEVFRRSAENLAFAVACDDDMKIASGAFKKEQVREDEAEAEVYMRQKCNGNVDKARELGRKLACALRDRAQALFQPHTRDEDFLLVHHRLLLFSYVANRVIADFSPNSILARTALNVFYDELESAEPELSGPISDMAAFSLYVLCERSEACNEKEIGKVYARLCGGDGQSFLAEEGERLYNEYYDVCSSLHEQTRYKSD